MLTALSGIVREDTKISKKSLKLLRWLDFRLSLLARVERVKCISFPDKKVSMYFEKQAYQLIGTYLNGEEGILTVCRHLIKDCDCFVDVGANRGLFSLSLYRPGLKKVVCIEPVYSTYLKLLKNIDLNPDVRIQAINAACSNLQGLLRITSDNDLQNSIVGEGDLRSRKTELVISVTLDQIYSMFLVPFSPRRVLVKVDVERHEMDVIAGAQTLFSSGIEIILALEFFSAENKLALAEFLKPFGFIEYMPAVKSSEDGIDLGDNIIFKNF